MYNPNKNYQWDSDTEFSFTGNEFGLILNTFRAILSTEQAMQILLIDRANSIIENKMNEYVKQGLIREKKDENTENPPENT